MTAAGIARPYETLHAAQPGSRPLTAEVLWALPRVGAPTPAPDGAYVIVPVTTYAMDKEQGVSRLWRLPAAGGAAQPLTAPERDAAQPAIAPDGSRLAFVSRTAHEKDAVGQLHLMSIDGGEATCHTDLPLGIFDPQWLPDASGLIFGAYLFEGFLTPEATRKEAARRKKDPPRVHATEARLFRFWDRWLTDGRVPHLFHLDLESGAIVDLMPDSTLWFSWMMPAGQYDIAPGGEEIVFSGLHVGGPENRLRSDVFRLPLSGRGGKPTCLTAHNAAGSVRPRYAPDGSRILYGRTEDADFYADRPRLVSIDRATGTEASILSDWDRAPGGWTSDKGGTLYFHAENEGAQALYRLDLEAAAEGGVPEPLGTSGTCAGPKPTADGFLYYTHHAANGPPEVWRCQTVGGAPERISFFTEEALRDVALGEVRDYRYEGAAGESVQVLVILPPDREEGRPLPLVHMFHGGPHGQFGDLWHFRWNTHALAAPGYAVACVNFQGSTSWGNDFAKRIQGAWGERPYEDVMKATDMLIEAGIADETKMAIGGGSYGGYLTSWIASQTDRFACAVNHAGVYDLTLQYASDVTWGRARNMGGEIWADAEAVDRWNPARHADGLNTPMLVIHGEQDYRVPINHALLCYGILQARGVPSRLLYFEDENHWILKPRNSLRWYAEVLSWLDRFLSR